MARELNLTPAKSMMDRVRDATSVNVAGGTLAPARVGRGYGVQFSKSFAKGGKIDGCAQRGKTKCKVV